METVITILGIIGISMYWAYSEPMIKLRKKTIPDFINKKLGTSNKTYNLRLKLNTMLDRIGCLPCSSFYIAMIVIGLLPYIPSSILLLFSILPFTFLIDKFM